MIRKIDLKDAETWKKERGKRIGGSDIACIIGMNQWKNNVQLWREKMGIEKPEDISGNPYVQYGTEAEPIIRSLFTLNHKDLRVEYTPDNMWLNDDYPFAHASLDGWLEDNAGNRGVLEIKTGSIMSKAQAEKWNGRIPDNYYCQVLWYMMVTDATFAWISALLTERKHTGEEVQVIREYNIYRDQEIEKEISFLAEEGESFWRSMKEKTQPSLILPKI
jgi:putative phage-type endonuclease